ncbi:MAG: hypothetical protein AMXMBFR4_33340 [Candidatus Hydrogenedentota bacterium]
MAAYAPQSGTETIGATREELRKPPMFRVLMHNDDYTPMDFVVAVLNAVFSKPMEEATRIMLNIHHNGIGVCGVYTQEIAETKIDQVHDLAQANEFPLRCSMEPAE